ncbi:MAG: HXXEE domain-containing protein [Pyrinomonadaceae bacterium]|nr:HXXEE domain-containing protein [Pyrinomonadaceae bacterium]
MSITGETREKKFAGTWAWLFPLTYLAHIAEEYWVGEGFPAWFSRLSGVELTPARFLALNRFALALMAVGIILALTVPPLRWLLISFGTVILINALAHAVGSAVTRSYSPGLISGLLLWLPLGALTLRRAWILRSRRAFWSGVMVGVLLHGIITVLALSGGRA